LYETVLSSSLSDSEFVSHLMVDLLDRNLYERSDDCRWWALTPELQLALAAPVKSGQTVARLTEILDYINSLYTVYTRIFIYDADGVIVASSDFKGDGLQVVGTSIAAETMELVSALSNDQQYYVTPFETTPLYGGRPTYVYHAAIRDPEHAARIVGGIGIVFDSEPEFSAMLEGALGGKEDVSALFVDRSGCIISSTDATRPVGSYLEIDPELLKMENGGSTSRIVIHDGHYAILGCTMSHGYREFKTSDGYREDVLAVVYKAFGVERQQINNSNGANTALELDPMAPAGREFATFFIDGALFAMAAEYVQEALPASAISPMSMGSRAERIGILALQHEHEAKRFVWVFDLGHLMRGYRSDIDSSSQVIVVQRGTQSIGLLVSELHGVPEFQPAQIVPTPLASPSTCMLVTEVIQANSGRLLIQSINVDHLFAVLNNEEIPIADEMKMAA
jgi:chemotaxis signal transduction protein